MAVPENVFVGGHGGFSSLVFARAELSEGDAESGNMSSVVVVGQAGVEEGTMTQAHLPLGSVPFEADKYHVLVVKNQPKLAETMETDLQWVRCPHDSR